MAIDISGGIFSFLSLFFRNSLDIAAFVRVLSSWLTLGQQGIATDDVLGIVCSCGSVGWDRGGPSVHLESESGTAATEVRREPEYRSRWCEW